MWTDWITLTDGHCTISVNLSSNASTGAAWTYELSRPVLVANTSEAYVPDGTQGDALGAGGVWSALFESTQSEQHEAGDVTLTFRYHQGDKTPVMTCIAELRLMENGPLNLLTRPPHIWSVEQAYEIVTAPAVMLSVSDSVKRCMVES